MGIPNNTACARCVRSWTAGNPMAPSLWVILPNLEPL